MGEPRRSTDDQRPELVYHVRYQYGDYSGTRTVFAVSDDQAIAKVRGWVHRNGSLTMAYESYRVIGVTP